MIVISVAAEDAGAPPSASSAPSAPRRNLLDPEDSKTDGADDADAKYPPDSARPDDWEVEL